jgi:cobalt/nickel transport protein
MKNKTLVFAIALICGGILSLFASSFPDGLEYVAGTLGFEHTASASLLQIFPDYRIPGIPNDTVASSLAGIVGVMLVFLFGYGLLKLLLRPAINQHPQA